MARIGRSQPISTLVLRRAVVPQGQQATVTLTSVSSLGIMPTTTEDFSSGTLPADITSSAGGASVVSDYGNPGSSLKSTGLNDWWFFTGSRFQSSGDFDFSTDVYFVDATRDIIELMFWANSPGASPYGYALRIQVGANDSTWFRASGGSYTGLSASPAMTGVFTGPFADVNRGYVMYGGVTNGVWYRVRLWATGYVVHVTITRISDGAVMLAGGDLDLDPARSSDGIDAQHPRSGTVGQRSSGAGTANGHRFDNISLATGPYSVPATIVKQATASLVATSTLVTTGSYTAAPTVQLVTTSSMDLHPYYFGGALGAAISTVQSNFYSNWLVQAPATISPAPYQVSFVGGAGDHGYVTTSGGTGYNLQSSQVFAQVTQAPAVGSLVFETYNYSYGDGYWIKLVDSTTLVAQQMAYGDFDPLNGQGRVVGTAPWDPAKPFLQVRESGGTVYYERSPRGLPGTWETFATGPRGWLGGLSVDLYCFGTPNTQVTSPASIGNVNTPYWLVEDITPDFTNSNVWFASVVQPPTTSKMVLSSSSDFVWTPSDYSLRSSRVYWRVSQYPTVPWDPRMPANWWPTGGAVWFESDLGYQYLFLVNAGMLGVYDGLNGDVHTQRALVAWDPGQQFLSIRESGGTVYYERSATGRSGSWSTVATSPVPGSQTGYLDLGYMNMQYYGTGTGTLQVESFNTLFPETGYPTVWDGLKFWPRPALVWNGSAWVQRPVSVWNGSAWDTVT